MNTKSNEFIKYMGIDTPQKLNTPYFKQLACNGQFLLSSQAPDMEDLMSVTAQATITTAQMIQEANQCRALINGYIKLSFQYATPDPRYSLYLEDHFLYFGEYLSLPEYVSHTIHLFPSIAIEDIFSYTISPRMLYHSAVILLMIQLG